MQLQWTGFEPFGGHDFNPSAEFARAAAQAMGSVASFEELPVTYACAQGFATDHTSALSSPWGLWHVGLAADRDGIWLEERALNHHGRSPDNDGHIPGEEGVLLPSGPSVLKTDVDVQALVTLCQARGLPVQVSQDAGSYVCNAILYHSLREAERVRALGQVASAIFVHIGAMSAEEARELGQRFGRALGEHLGLTEFQGR